MTPYANAGFLQQLEDYHAGAARAHRTHSQVAMSMPVLRPQRFCDQRRAPERDRDAGPRRCRQETANRRRTRLRLTSHWSADRTAR
jgi:hypothetical protein